MIFPKAQQVLLTPPSPEMISQCHLISGPFSHGLLGTGRIPTALPGIGKCQTGDEKSLGVPQCPQRRHRAECLDIIN